MNGKKTKTVKRHILLYFFNQKFSFFIKKIFSYFFSQKFSLIVFLYFWVKNPSMWIFLFLLSFISNRRNYTFLPKDEGGKVFFYLFWELIKTFCFHHMNQKHKLTNFLEFALYFCNEIFAYLFNQKFLYFTFSFIF